MEHTSAVGVKYSTGLPGLPGRVDRRLGGTGGAIKRGGNLRKDGDEPLSFHFLRLRYSTCDFLGTSNGRGLRAGRRAHGQRSEAWGGTGNMVECNDGSTRNKIRAILDRDRVDCEHANDMCIRYYHNPGYSTCLGRKQ